MHKAPVAHRTVKPRKPTRDPFLPIISYTSEAIYVERTETYQSGSDIFTLVLTEPPSIIVAQGVAALLRDLHERFHEHPDWQFKCSPIERERFGPERQRQSVVTTDTMVTWLGFRGRRIADGPRGGKRHEPNRYHRTLDPVTFTRKSIDELSELTGLEALHTWATQVRRFAARQNVSLRATGGSLSSQFLRDSRFYPVARRKVPSATNAHARDQLPGNHYRLMENEGTEHDAYYLDQIASHHNCAKDIHFPHANELRAYGHFRTLENKRGLPLRSLSGRGLFYCKIQVPHLPITHFAPPWAMKSGERTAYIYSNELSVAAELGIQIEYVIAAWISNVRDRGLNKYAEWSLSQLKEVPTYERAWLKPILLSTYGILAASPRIHRVGFAKATGGTSALYPAGAGHLPVIEHATTRPAEPAYSNVIHRGMVEAEARQRSLALARNLSKQGHRIIAVYADSVFVHARNIDDENVPLPLPPEGWQVEQVLTRLRFLNPVSFTSDQITKLPGIPARDLVLAASRGTQYNPGTNKPPQRRGHAARQKAGQGITG